MSEILNMVMLVLPMPPSVNAIWGWKKTGVYRTQKYKDWLAEAHVAFLQQKKAAGTPVKGHFTYHVVLDEKSRTSVNDGDNLSSKALLDFLQSVRVIENDSLADAGSWSWGPCDPGFCNISVYQRGMQSVTAEGRSA